jgi:uncharacterized protein (TIGR03086 family)
MDIPALLRGAAAPMHDLLTTVTAQGMAAPTPCTQFDVRALLQHLLTWGPVLEAAARKEPAAPAEPTAEDPANAYDEQLRRITAAWSDPAAWEGSTTMGGPDPMPAALIGGMVVSEIVVHGWDLGRALGRHPAWEPAVLELVLGEVTATAEMGRGMGIYADAVPVPATAPTLDRLLGITGRDPQWAASHSRSTATGIDTGAVAAEP